MSLLFRSYASSIIYKRLILKWDIYEGPTHPKCNIYEKLPASESSNLCYLSIILNVNVLFLRKINVTIPFVDGKNKQKLM